MTDNGFSAKRRVHERVLAELAPGTDVTALDVARLATDELPLLPMPELELLVDDVLAEVRGLGRLEAVLADADLTELMVNGPGPVWIERAGHVEALDLELDADEIRHLVERVVAPLGLRADRSAPLVDARLADGSRVNIVMPPLAVDGPYLTIRRFAAMQLPLGAFCPRGVAALLKWAVRARANVLVSGGTGSGKTTLLNALAADLPAGERIVTVEDAAELRLPQPHVVRLEARPANAEGAGEVRIRSLVRNALRMRPDRIVVGEVRGPEALDMLQAMNTGHEGSLSTCHANGPLDALRRIETMALMSDVGLSLAAIREQVQSALDLVVQVRRHPDGSRSVVEVAEVVAASDRPSTRALADARRLIAAPLREARDESAGPPPSPRPARDDA